MTNIDLVTIPYEMYCDLVWRAASYNTISEAYRKDKALSGLLQHLIEEEDRKKEGVSYEITLRNR